MMALVYGIVQRAGRNRRGAPLDRHVRLVDEVAVEDVVAGVAAVVAAGRGVVVGPRVAERVPAVVVAPDPDRHLGDACEYVDTRCDGGDIGLGDEPGPVCPMTR